MSKLYRAIFAMAVTLAVTPALGGCEQTLEADKYLFECDPRDDDCGPAYTCVYDQISDRNYCTTNQSLGVTPQPADAGGADASACSDGEREYLGECVPGCASTNDCPDSYECHFPPSVGAGVCLYRNPTLGADCQEDSTCNGLAPGFENSEPLCFPIDDAGGLCTVEGCIADTATGIAYGPATGCGVASLCFEGLCMRACTPSSPCPNPKGSRITCQYVERVDGTPAGICTPSCQSDDECSDGDGVCRDGQCLYACSDADERDICESGAGECVEVDGKSVCDYTH